MARVTSRSRTSTQSNPRKAPLYGRKAERPVSAEENITKKATNWLLFWLVAGIQIGKDVLDLVWGALEALGVGLSATVVGSVIGIPITIFAVGISWLISLTVFIIAMTYFVYTKQSVILRLVIISISTIIGMIPALNIVPDATLGFFIATFVSQIAKVGKLLIGGVAGKVLGGAKQLVT